MKLTAITGNLSQKALRRLTSKAPHPEYKPIQGNKVDVRSLTMFKPWQVGELFHATSAAYFAGTPIPEGGWMFVPLLSDFRTYLELLGYSRFSAEKLLKLGQVTGRADLVAFGRYGSAVVEFKVTEMPWEADEKTMIQCANYGYMLSHHGRRATAAILGYVDLRRGRIETYRWSDHREVCRPLRELNAA